MSKLADNAQSQPTGAPVAATSVSSPPAVPPPAPWGPLFAVIALLAAYSLTVGYVYPAVAFNLKIKEFTPFVIGAQSAMSGLGILVGSLIAPWVAERVGPLRTTICSLLISAGIIILIGVIPPVAVWFALRFMLGFTTSVLFVLSETWINQLAPEHLRGRIIGVYTSVLAGVFALGPILTNVLGFEGWRPFTMVAMLLLVFGLPLLFFRRGLPGASPHESGGLMKSFARIPVLMLGVAAFGYFDGAVLSLWPVYGLDKGVDVERAALLLTLLIIGNVVLQFPIGWLADRFSRRSLFTLCAAFGFFGAAMLPLTDLNATYIYAYLIIWGALSFGIYTLAMTIVGEALRGAQLIAANAGFGIMWGVGAVAGSAVTGWLMAQIGANGLPISLAVVFGILMLASLFLPPLRLPKPDPETLDK